jgi:hypothetical protein
MIKESHSKPPGESLEDFTSEEAFNQSLEG